MRKHNLPPRFQYQGLQSLTPAVLRESDKRAAFGQDTAEARLRIDSDFFENVSLFSNDVVVVGQRKTLSHASLTKSEL